VLHAGRLIGEMTAGAEYGMQSSVLVLTGCTWRIQVCRFGGHLCLLFKTLAEVITIERTYVSYDLIAGAGSQSAKVRARRSTSWILRQFPDSGSAGDPLCGTTCFPEERRPSSPAQHLFCAMKSMPYAGTAFLRPQLSRDHVIHAPAGA